TSRAATRPAASPSGTRSVRAIGTTAACSARRASSSEITDVNGRISGIFASSRGLTNEMPELGNQQLLERQPHCRLRSGQRDDYPSRREPRTRTAQHRGGSNLLKTQHPKQLAESVEAFLQHRVDDFVRHIARRNPRAP